MRLRTGKLLSLGSLICYFWHEPGEVKRRKSMSGMFVGWTGQERNGKIADVPPHFLYIIVHHKPDPTDRRQHKFLLIRVVALVQYLLVSLCIVTLAFGLVYAGALPTFISGN